MTSREPGIPELSPLDRELVDRLVEAGFDLRVVPGVPAEQMPRLKRIAGLFRLLNDYPVEDPDETLVDVTLARIDQHERQRNRRMSFETEHVKQGRRFSGRDVIGVLAACLVLAAILGPTISHLHGRAIDMRCANNLRQMGDAFAAYSNDYAGAVPIVLAGSDLSWERVRNVFNLQPLLQGDYCEHGHLKCPGGHEHASSYSYQWQEPGVRIVWDQQPASVILGDRNPLIDAYRDGDLQVSATALTRNHGGRGQNVVATDGSTVWLIESVTCGGDNIWLPEGQRSLVPGALPMRPQDTFLTH